MKRFTTFFLFLLLSVTAQSQVTYLKAVLDGGQEVPANASTATGVAIVNYDPATRFLQLTGDYQGLAAAITATHIHSPAAPGSTAGVLVTLTHTGGTSGSISGSATLTAGQEADLLAGNMYVNVHNSLFGAGEIRGQLTTTTAGQTDYLTARLQGAQEVPPNGSGAKGNATLLLDKTTGMVYLTGSFTGLTANATAAHIHAAAPNIIGGVIVTLSVTAGTQGTVHAASSITPGNQALMSAGNTYVNIHNANFTGGEIRGQLIAESQLVYLKAILQGSQEVPANASTAKGTVIVRYNKALRSLELTGDYQNLAANANNAHIHSPAAPGSNASALVLLNFTPTTSGGLSGNATLTAGQEADLLAGLMYVNVHNPTYPGGEIRGQLTTTTGGSQTYYLTGKFSGAQEVPAVASTATGDVTVLLDRLTREVFLTGTFSGLAANATAGHIHRGPAGSFGGVVVNLSPTAFTSGSLTGTGTVTASFADSMIRGLSYANIHNASFTAGEIRAQLGNLVLPVKLAYFNGYRQNNKVMLAWESEQELDLQHYEIEQQGIEPGLWINKGVVPARKINLASKYNFTDIPLVNNLAYGLYRLKMVDTDGQLSYSNTIRINNKLSAAALSIATNPVSGGMLQYVITGIPTNKRANVSIIDYTGRVVMRTTASTLTTNRISIGNLAAGMYRLVVQADGDILQQGFTK